MVPTFQVETQRGTGVGVAVVGDVGVVEDPPPLHEVTRTAARIGMNRFIKINPSLSNRLRVAEPQEEKKESGCGGSILRERR